MLDCPPFRCGIFCDRFYSEVAKEFQISGLPEWGDTGRDVYDISAKVEGNRTPTTDQVRRMLRTLLAERFQLKIHHETKVLLVYALVVANNGRKLTPVPEDEGKALREIPKRGTAAPAPAKQERPSQGPSSRGFPMSMQELAYALSDGIADRPVIDQTGLKGLYEIDLIPLLQSRRAGPEASVFTLVQELGLKLKAQKGPVDIVAIDRVERPSEN